MIRRPSEILGLIPAVVVGHIVDSYCLGFKRGVIHIVVLCYIVNDHYLKSFMSLGLVILSTAAA